MRARSISMSSWLFVSAMAGAGSSIVGCSSAPLQDAPQSKNTAPTGQTPGATGPRGSGPDGATGPNGGPVEPYFPAGGIDGPAHVDFFIGDPTPSSFDRAPYPSELWRKPDGKLDLSKYPAADHFLGKTYVETIQRDTDGFSIAPGIYMHFDGEPDLSNLSLSPGDTMSMRSPIFMMDVDDNSPAQGEYIPVEFKWYMQGDGKYLQSRTLAIKPVAGFVLRSNTTYAVVVQRSLATPSGTLLGTTADFEFMKWTEARPGDNEERLRQAHYPAFNYLAENGLARADIAAAAVFRTGTPEALFTKMYDKVLALPAGFEPKILSATQVSENSTRRVIQGYYCTPNFQSGINQAPFANGGGSIVAVAGEPQLQSMEGTDYATEDCGKLLKARFILTLPASGTMPLSGWPIIETAHGTGGSAESELSFNDLADRAAKLGMATVATDQVLHGKDGDPGERPGANKTAQVAIPGIPIGIPLKSAELFYNPVNPAAGRDNARQSAIDAVVLVRLITAGSFAASGVTGNLKFDRNKIMVFGHSQGSQTNSPMAVVEPLVRGTVLSGAGGDIRYGILYRTKPEIIQGFTLRTILATAFAMNESQLDEFHPLMSMAQHIADPVDPQTWARFYREPLPGKSPQSVLLYEGTKDNYNPYQTSEALAVAFRAVPVQPAVVQSVLGLGLNGIDPAAAPLSANVAGGKATAALVQFDTTVSEDGHFVIYTEPNAFEWAENFYESGMADPVPTVSAP